MDGFSGTVLANLVVPWTRPARKDLVADHMLPQLGLLPPAYGSNFLLQYTAYFGSEAHHLCWLFSMASLSISSFLCLFLCSHGRYTVCMSKGAKGTWCVTHGTGCTTVAVTCDKVDEVHKGGVKHPKNHYIGCFT